MVNPIQVQKFLSGIDYPCKKQDLITRARTQGADDQVLSALEKLPDQMFNSPNDISDALGKIKE